MRHFLYLMVMMFMFALNGLVAGGAEAGELQVLVSVTETDTASSALATGSAVTYPRPTATNPAHVDTKGFDDFRLEWDITTANGSADSINVVLEGCSEATISATSIWNPIDTLAINSSTVTISECTDKVYRYVRYKATWTQASLQDIHSHRLVGIKPN